MNILLIDNNTIHKKALATALAGHNVEVQVYKPGIDFSEKGKDLVVLSGGGGEGQEIADRHTASKLWYQDQMDYVLSTQKPIIGICMGFEVIAKAFGGEVAQMDITYEGFKDIQLIKSGSSATKPRIISQYNSHNWHVSKVSQKQLKILASSHTGIEIIQHRTRPIIATQFHPEKGGTLVLSDLFKALTI